MDVSIVKFDCILGWMQIGYMVLMAAISYAVYYLMKEKPPLSPLDQSNIDPSIRGSICSYVLGRRSISPIVGWIGNLWVEQREVPTSGGKGGGGDGPTQNIYWMSGMHILCLGQGDALYGIYERGIQIYNQTLTKATHPSGTTITTLGQGTFRIYWGDAVQTPDAALTTYTGYECGFNNIMYLVWDRKALGASKVWPMLEYDIKVLPQFSTLFGNPVWIEGSIQTVNYNVTVASNTQGGGLPLLVDGVFVRGRDYLYSSDIALMEILIGTTVSFSYGGNDYSVRVYSVSPYWTGTAYIYQIATIDPLSSMTNGTPLTIHTFRYTTHGLNPAAILYQMMFGSYPFGLGYNTANYNLTDLEDVFNTFDTGEDLELPASIVLDSKKSFLDGIAMILQDCAIALAWDVETAQYRFTVIKSTDTPEEITKDYYLLTKDHDFTEVGYSTLAPDQRHFTFFDSNRRFEQSSIMISDDGAAKYAKTPGSKAVGLYTITDLETASRFAIRRDREFYIRGGLELEISSIKSNMTPGNLYTFEGLTGQFRLVKKEHSNLQARFKASLLEDLFSVDFQPMVTIPSGIKVDGKSVTFKDIAFRLFEVNRYIAPDQHGIIYLRIRGSKNYITDALYLSSDDVTYSTASVTSRYATGGTLVEALPNDTNTTITTGPVVTFLGYDIDYVKNYTGNDYAWRAGSQLVFINDEICFLQNISPTENEFEYTLDGLIRGRLGTSIGTHAIGDEVYIVQANDLIIITDPILLKPTTIYGKSVPFSESSVIDISTVDAVSIVYGGGGYRPLPCVNFTAEDKTTSWLVGGDLDLVWGYRNITGDVGAGISLSNAPYNVPLPEGYFKLEVMDGVDVVRTITTTYAYCTYSQANIIEDFTSEPSSITIKLYNILNSCESQSLEVIFERV